MKKEVKSIKSGKMPEGIIKAENDFTQPFKDPIKRFNRMIKQKSNKKQKREILKIIWNLLIIKVYEQEES